MAGNVSRILLSIVVLAALGAGAGWAGEVTICHVPPGNPENERTISVGEKAVDAHLAHGDHLGECACDAAPATEALCEDGEDNDCDGAVDAEDPDCGFCGDGVMQPPEECDDGNTNPFDGCDSCIFVDTTPD